MPKIPDNTVRQVIDAARIEEVVSQCGYELKRAGTNYTCLCPFHDDHNIGNFIVRPAGVATGGNTYNCFACGVKGGPLQFVMESQRLSFPDAVRWLGKMYHVPVDDVPLDYTPPPPREVPPPPPPLSIPRTYVKRTMATAKTRSIIFIDWLRSLPWDTEQKARLEHMLWLYCVGGWENGRVVFWMIDNEGNARAAKLMKFYPKGHPKYGHRDKESHPGWIYNQEGIRQELDPEHHTILKPLFGSHLLKRYPKARAYIVESEKTALVMATYDGKPETRLWLACGGLQNMKRSTLQPLIDQGREIWLMPDRDGVKKWEDICRIIGYDYCRVDTEFLKSWRETDGEKADIADIVLRMMAEAAQRDTTDGAEQVSEERRVKSEEFTSEGSNETGHPCIVEDRHLQRMIDILDLEEITTHTNATQR